MSGTDTIPLLPPLPGASRPLETPAVLARLVTELGTVVMTAETAAGEALVVFLDRQVAVAAATRGQELITGAAALEEFAAASIGQIRVLEVGRDVARALRAYLGPDVVRGLPASSVAPEAFIHSFARPGQETCVIVEVEGDTGVVFLDGAGAVHAYTRSAGEVGGLERVARLLADPLARLTVRAGQGNAGPRPGPAGRAVATPAPAPAPRPAPAPVELAAAAVDRSPKPANGALAAFLASTAADASATVPVAAPPPQAVAASPELLEAVLAEVRSLLGRNGARIEEELRAVPPTPEAIATAVRGLRDRRVRLIGAATLDLLVERTDLVLERLAKRPPEPPS